MKTTRVSADRGKGSTTWFTRRDARGAASGLNEEEIPGRAAAEGTWGPRAG